MKKILFALLMVLTTSAFAGHCDYPDQLASDGSICGGRAASVRPGGYEPPPEYGRQQPLNLDAMYNNTPRIQSYQKSEYEITGDKLNEAAPYYNGHDDFLIHYDCVDNSNDFHSYLTRGRINGKYIFIVRSGDGHNTNYGENIGAIDKDSTSSGNAFHYVFKSEDEQQNGQLWTTSNDDKDNTPSMGIDTCTVVKSF
ncbi:hypothetical protein MUU47_21755 [Scandinavium sp. H11S7]|uniref:Secreted protein n=2 Tax=Scandinavium hiltneri TaxID=2926519 RepID=A0ABT2E722_9ENTR|nr:hypothetical protein [Scandinavium hiltneri]